MLQQAIHDPAVTVTPTVNVLPETIACWKWKPKPGYRSEFGATAVNVLHRMVSRHFPHPHRFVCVTDDPTGIDAGIEIVPIWNDYADVPSPHGGKNPSCYRRLRLYHPEAEQWFGKRFVSMDLDMVITADVTPLWDRPEEIVFYGDTNRHTHYNGSMVLMTAGSRSQVWTEFDPRRSPIQSMRAGCFGSDQGWISYKLGGGEQKWGKADGVYSYRNDLQPMRPLPQNARLVVFHGRLDPWHPYAQRIPWVVRHWR